MKQLFEKVQLNHLTLKNRIIRSATWEGAAMRDGSISEDIIKIYDALAQGGVGGIISGFTSVSDDDVYINGVMRLSRDENIAQYKRLTDVVHAQNCPIIAQLALGAYYKKMPNGKHIQMEPDDMSKEDILYVEQQFVDAAIRASKAGFDGIQIHAAHFFFLSRFISPATNHRTDEFGGSNQNRAKILFDILQKIRKSCPEHHITIKINCDDFVADGLTIHDSHEICKALAQQGIDSIEISGNGTSVRGIRPGVNEAYFAPLAIQLAREVNTPIILVGGMRSRAKMDALLAETNISLISMSRPLLREPNLPNLLREGKSTLSKCISCNACYNSHLHQCIFR